MWDRDIQEYRIEMEQIINSLGMQPYWWTIFDAEIIFFVQKKQMNVKLPLPKIYDKTDPWYKKKNDAEMERVRNIWSSFIEILKIKLDRVSSGQSSVEEEFKDGIQMGDGYGLVYKGEVKVIR